MHLLWEERYQAELGQFVLRLHSGADSIQIVHRGAETILLTLGHEITVRRPMVPTDLPPGMSVSAATAWAYYVRKQNTEKEQLIFSIRIDDLSPSIEAGPDTGEWLTAIEFADDTWQVHLGTQDEDHYAWQAKAGQEVPQRLQAELASYQLIITNIDADGLTTQVPLLLEQEQFYLHYVLAESPRRRSVDFPEEWDISTWFCVDLTRAKLEEAWRHM